MSELSPETENLLKRGRGGEALPSARRDEIKGAVLAKLATGAILTTSTSAAAWTVSTKVIGVAVLAAVVSAGTVGVVKYQAKTRTPSASQVAASRAPSPSISDSPVASTQDLPPAAPAMTVTAGAEPAQTQPVVLPIPDAPTPISTSNTNPKSPSSTPMIASDSPQSATTPRPSSTATMMDPNASTVANSPATTASASAPQSSLQSENALVQSAHAALAAGDAVTALRLLDEHARRFPNGTLEPERSAERVFALCAEQKTDDARAAAARFLSAHPTGPLASRVRSSCGGH